MWRYEIHSFLEMEVGMKVGRRGRVDKIGQKSEGSEGNCWG
jgi:hypothetical protein